VHVRPEHDDYPADLCVWMNAGANRYAAESYADPLITNEQVRTRITSVLRPFHAPAASSMAIVDRGAPRPARGMLTNAKSPDDADRTGRPVTMLSI
jgi:hypothetical protein